MIINRTHYRYIFAILIVLSAVCFIGFFLCKPIVATVNSREPFININPVTQDDIDQKKKERDDAKARAEDASAQVSALQGEASELSAELIELQGLSDAQMEQYEEIASQYAAALIAKADALDKYVEAQEKLTETKENFSQRISVMFEYQNKSTLEVLLESDSLAGFFTNMEIITLIADSDDQMVDQMKIALDEAQLESDNALLEAEELESIATEKQAQLQELIDRIGVTEDALDDVNTQITTLEQQEDELNELASSLDSEIAALQSQLYAQSQPKSSGGSSGSSTGTGKLSWPTWTTWVTSEYGYRVHPVYGTTKFHSGIDIGAGMGDTIMAADSGTVIFVSEPCPGCNTGGSGYGNYMIIDHGNGVSTLYGHCRDVYVSYGEYVNKGEAIGEVGSTGTSTGAHLHFEVREYGSTVDPRGYLG